jgi:hypothetical protein
VPQARLSLVSRVYEECVAGVGRDGEVNWGHGGWAAVQEIMVFRQRIGR